MSVRAVRRRLIETAHRDLIAQAVRVHNWLVPHVVDMLLAVDGNQAWLEALYERFQRESKHQKHGKPSGVEGVEHGRRVLNFVRYHAPRDRKGK